MGIIALIRLAIFFFLGWMVFRLIRKWLNRPAPVTRKRDEKIDTMVRCAQCGVHTPQNQAVTDHGNFFCCKEHRDEYRQ